MKESEADFQTWVKETALTAGWLYYHTHDSRHSDEGFPDLVLLKGAASMFIELKRDGQNPTAAQTIWIEALRRADLFADVWRPHNRPEIMGLLGLEVVDE